MSRPVAHSTGHVAYRGPSGAIYLNITNRCSSSCEFCLREWSDSVYGADLVLDAEPETDDVLVAIARLGLEWTLRAPREAQALRAELTTAVLA